jgi:hypothetical protein
VYAEELSARLRVGGQIFGGNVEGAGRVGLIDGDIDAAQPRAIHAHVGNEIASLVGHGDVHWLTYLLRLLLSRSDNSTCVFQPYHSLLLLGVIRYRGGYGFGSSTSVAFSGFDGLALYGAL